MRRGKSIKAERRTFITAATGFAITRLSTTFSFIFFTLCLF